MSELAKVAAEWENQLAKQEATLHQRIPSTIDEATHNATQRLQDLKQRAYQIGYHLRKTKLMAQGNPIESAMNPDALPGRAMQVSMPWLAKAGGFADEAVFNPLSSKVRDLFNKVRHKAELSSVNARATTADPNTLPEYKPSVALAVPSALQEGMRAAEQEHHGGMEGELKTKVESARQDFENALRDEFATRGSKAASAPELLEGLADLNFKKAEAGWMNDLGGLYLAMAGLVGSGAHGLGQHWVEENDPRYLKAKALREAVHNRAAQNPVQLSFSIPRNKTESEPIVPDKVHSLENAAISGTPSATEEPLVASKTASVVRELRQAAALISAA